MDLFIAVLFTVIWLLCQDYCGNTKGTFSVRVESVPCCEKVLTCSRSIVLVLQGKVTVTLSDMKVTKNLQQNSTMQENSLYSIDTVGLYIIVSVPSSGITLIWDKHTLLTIKLHENWRSKVCGLCGNFDSNEMNDLQISGSAVGSSPRAFGNSWKAATPPCSDVTADIFPCDRNSYCSAWAQRRCMIIKGDTFKDCHIKVDPNPYYQACLLESCSCEFEGKFLVYCTAVAAYAEACSDQDVCVKWRTPDLCHCKGPRGEPKLPGEVWVSNCNLCTCNNQTRTEECFPKPLCGPSEVLVTTSCCGDQMCVEKTCTYNDQTYKVGDTWTDAAHPCMSFSCSKEGVLTETKVCLDESCPEEDRIWDDKHCCFTCNQTCIPSVSSVNVTIDNCTTVIQIPVCQGQCTSQPRVVLQGDLLVQQESRCCQEDLSEWRSRTLRCFDLTARNYTYNHVTSCVCRICSK